MYVRFVFKMKIFLLFISAKYITIFMYYSLFVNFYSLKSQTTPQPWQVTQMIRQASLPFLRCAAVLYHHITNIPVPSVLQGNFFFYCTKSLYNQHYCASVLQNNYIFRYIKSTHNQHQRTGRKLCTLL